MNYFGLNIYKKIIFLYLKFDKMNNEYGKIFLYI